MKSFGKKGRAVNLNLITTEGYFGCCLKLGFGTIKIAADPSIQKSNLLGGLKAIAEMNVAAAAKAIAIKTLHAAAVEIDIFNIGRS